MLHFIKCDIFYISNLISYYYCILNILDAIRVNVKFSVVPEKEIDNSLGIWLSHAPFRIKKVSQKQEKLSKSLL